MYKLFLLAFLFQSIVAMGGDSLRIVQKPVNFGYANATQRMVDAVIIHSTFNNSGGEHYDIDKIITQFARYRVSAHYVIARDGLVYQLVDNKNIAYHAGKSTLPNGASNVNSRSIGIEIMTNFEESPTDLQIGTIVELLKNIKQTYSIKYLLRHSDIAPGRKTDPWNMNWDEFVEKCKAAGLTDLITKF